MKKRGMKQKSNMKLTTLETIPDRIINTITPDKKEREQFNLVTKSFLTKLNAQFQDAKAILGGSGAKDTWLAEHHDVDIFVMFNLTKYRAKSAELSNLVELILKKAFPGVRITRVHGSRDYFHLTYQALNFEVVPILKIAKAAQAVNITDISPLHAVWVNKHGKKLKDEIRLAKQFFNANEIYGAESYLAGFSGYVVEILVIHYGSFENLLRAVQKWKHKEVIDPTGYYKGKDVLFELNKSKIVSPLIVIDPVDKTRNAAAAVSQEKFLLLKKRAIEYLKKPSAAFFAKQENTFAALKKEAGKKKYNFVYVEINPMQGKEDVVGMKLLKTYNFLKQELQPFLVKKSGWEWQDGGLARVYFFLAKKELPPYELRLGPPLEMKEHVRQFKKKNKNSYVENGRVYAKVKLSFPQLADMMKNLLQKSYVREKIRDVKKVEIL